MARLRVSGRTLPGPADPWQRKFKVHGERTLERIPQVAGLSEERRFAMRVVAQVLPFRVNTYVLEHLIDWDRVPEDPIFQLTFPQPEMLQEEHFRRVADLLRAGAGKGELREVVRGIHRELKPHPAGQLSLNVPVLDGRLLWGLQHKYPETVLFFPKQGQSCHSYCTFCFRWAQFVGNSSLRFSSRGGDDLQRYLARHREVSDLLLTGGDPMVVRTKILRGYIEPLLDPGFDHLQDIRIGTKALSYWPQRFVTDPDADDLLRLFERIVAAGRHVAIMAHFSHWREMEPAMVHEAIRRIRDTGAVIRSQSPVVAHINDDPAVWETMWRRQVRLGIVPYYMFVVRDTGAKRYFEVPLVRAWEIYREAFSRVSGLSRTVRGPSMSAGPGKVEVQGVAEIEGQKVFVLRFIQGRDPDWVQRPFFARFDPAATWLDELKPAFGERFFSEDGYDAIRARFAEQLREVRPGTSHKMATI
jgi:L-lysine 2,3-aminomutase